jgi:hypothetical protein
VCTIINSSISTVCDFIEVIAFSKKSLKSLDLDDVFENFV